MTVDLEGADYCGRGEPRAVPRLTASQTLSEQPRNEVGNPLEHIRSAQLVATLVVLVRQLRAPCSEQPAKMGGRCAGDQTRSRAGGLPRGG